MRASPDNENWLVFDGHRVFYLCRVAGDPIVFLPDATVTRQSALLLSSPGEK